MLTFPRKKPKYVLMRKSFVTIYNPPHGALPVKGWQTSPFSAGTNIQ